MGGLLAAVLTGLGGGEQAGVVGDVLQGDPTAIASAVGAVAMALRLAITGNQPSPVDATPISLPLEPTEEIVDRVYDEDAVKEAIESVLEGKVMGGSPEEFAAAWAKLAGGDQMDSETLVFAIPFGAALYQYAQDKKVA